MGVPDFQSMMLRVLEALRNGQERASRAIRDDVGTALHLSPADLAEMLPSGKQSVLANRAAWATIYLERAALVERTKRGVYR